MTFHIEFSYCPNQRETLLPFLQSGGLATEGGIALKGAWVAVQTGVGYAIIEASDARLLFDLCARWSEHGEVKVTPLMSVQDL